MKLDQKHIRWGTYLTVIIHGLATFPPKVTALSIQMVKSTTRIGWGKTQHAHVEVVKVP